eukprot:6023416-Pleurochrysis_carterae.AAC.1
MQNPWTGASTTLPGCFAWADSLFEAPCLLSAQGSAGQRFGSVACVRCEMSLRAWLHASVCKSKGRD